MPETLKVELGARSYDIIVGDRLLPRAGEFLLPRLKSKRVIIISDETVAKLYLHRLTSALEEKHIASRSIIMPVGEQTKSLEAYSSLMETLLEQKPDRQIALIALGGGVIGDLTGFAAGTLLRGVDFIQIPTTLLSQVDSSVGGKTGINSRYGKNLIGAFHQPVLVLSDVATLLSLPQREWLAGYAEMLKYALIGNTEFFDWLEKNAAAMLAGDAKLLTHAIIKSCAAKAAIVSADEREGGRRALLNFGHTFAHALEAETGYGPDLLHGEAVAIGMIMALKMSVSRKLCPMADLERVLKHYKAIGLPDSPRAIRKQWNTDALMEHFTRDKKAKAGTLTFILAHGIGNAFIAEDVDKTAVRRIVMETCG